MENKEKTNFKKMPWFKIYWSGKKSINVEEILHKRDDEIKGHKLTIEGTIDMWKTKTTIMLEKAEIFEVLGLIYWNTNEVVIKRKNETTKENKSITIMKNINSWDTLIKVDSSKSKDKIMIKVDLLNIMILKNLCETIIIKEIKRDNNVILNLDYIKDYINNLHKNDNRNITNDWNNNMTNNNNVNDSIVDTEFKVKYINNYNWKDSENIIENLTEIQYNYFKDKKHLQINDNTRDDLINSLKELNIDNWKKYFFLNKDNFNTLTIK